MHCGRIVLIFLLIAQTVMIMQGGDFWKHFVVRVVQADEQELQQIEREIRERTERMQLSISATIPLEAEVVALERGIANTRARIGRARAEADRLAGEIVEREESLSWQYQVLAERVRAQYKRARQLSPLLTLAAQSDATQLTRDLAYRSAVREQDNRIIIAIGQDILDLEAAKTKLESDQIQLAKLEVQLDDQADFFKNEIAQARSYQQTLRSEIEQLSARQKAIIAARSGSFLTAVGEVPLADDFNASIGFKAQAPSNSFAIFSFGAYTHRNGMSQYGAKARADDGQSYEEILAAYYPGTSLKKDYAVMGSITVDGTGTIPFEDQYLHGIFEIPNSWPLEVQKAQAIAARTYAIRRTSNGQNSICATEACQVFKNQRKSGTWERAVNETRGMVLVTGDGSPAQTQYASTHGGYSNTSGWDTTDKSGQSDWASRAWDARASSPWFYKSWYRVGYSSSGASCGRSHPWLSEREFADIINAWIVRNNPAGADTGRIQPVTINDCTIGGSGGNPYSIDELRDRANQSGGAVTSISSVSVSHNDNGQTSQVRLETNRGTITITGSEFKEAFNLRAPGYIRIPQNGFSFFNVEHKK